MFESELEKRVVGYCKEHHLGCYKFVSPSHKGVPDRILIFPGGKVAFVELKAPKGVRSVLQTYEQVKLRGWGAAVWTCNNFETFKAWAQLQ